MYYNRVTNVYFFITVLRLDLMIIRCFAIGLKIDYGGLCDAGDVCMGENTECSLTDNRCRCVQGFAIDFVTGLCGLCEFCNPTEDSQPYFDELLMADMCVCMTFDRGKTSIIL